MIRDATNVWDVSKSSVGFFFGGFYGVLIYLRGFGCQKFWGLWKGKTNTAPPGPLQLGSFDPYFRCCPTPQKGQWYAGFWIFLGGQLLNQFCLFLLNCNLPASACFPHLVLSSSKPRVFPLMQGTEQLIELPKEIISDIVEQIHSPICTLLYVHP